MRGKGRILAGDKRFLLLFAGWQSHLSLLLNLQWNQEADPRIYVSNTQRVRRLTWNGEEGLALKRALGRSTIVYHRVTSLVHTL